MASGSRSPAVRAFSSGPVAKPMRSDLDERPPDGTRRAEPLMDFPPEFRESAGFCARSVALHLPPLEIAAAEVFSNNANTTASFQAVPRRLYEDHSRGACDQLASGRRQRPGAGRAEGPAGIQRHLANRECLLVLHHLRRCE